MVVSQQAVQSFLERHRKDSTKAKRFSDRVLDAKLRKLGARFETPPYRCQKVAFLLGARYPGYVFLLDPGLGKTKLTLDLFRWRRDRGEARHALILVPNIGNLGAWEAEVAKHAPEMSVSVLFGARADREALIASKTDITVATYAGWNALVCRRVKGRKGRNKMDVDPAELREASRGLDFLVLDESTNVKNPQSLTFKVIRHMGRSTRFRYALTGTPFDKDPGDLWSQFYSVDGGETLGETLGLFRAAFFREKPNYWSGGNDYEFDQRKTEQLNRVLRHRSIRFEEREALDLPETIGGVISETGLVKRTAPMSEECARYYGGYLKEIRVAQGNVTLMENAYTRMRQLTSGILSARDEEDERHELLLKAQPKLDLLLDLLDELPPDDKVIVFHHFRPSGRLICERLEARKVGHYWLWSGAKRRAEHLSRFDRDPKMRVLVSSSSGMFGLNLQVARHAVFYESPDSVILRQQAERRIRRAGQTRRTHVYDLAIRGAVDERILDALLSGKRLFDELVAGRASLTPPEEARPAPVLTRSRPLGQPEAALGTALGPSPPGRPS